MKKKLCVCCIVCQKVIKEKGNDPCAIVLISKWTGPDKKQLSQQWFAHIKCFFKALGIGRHDRREEFGGQSEFGELKPFPKNLSL